MDEFGTGASMDRRRFIRNALILGWATPVIFTLASEDALAQVINCGTFTNGACTSPASCPPSRPTCSKTGGSGSACTCA